MKGQTKMIIIVGVIFGMLFLTALGFLGQRKYTAYIDSLKAQIRQEFQKSIDEKDAEIKKHKERYAQLKALIAKKATEAQNINPPKDTAETRKRLKDLGYESH